MKNLSRVYYPSLLLLLAGGCTKQPSATVFVDPALATLVPSDTVMLAGIRVQQLAKTPFWTEYVQKGRVPVYEEFRKTTGLNPGKDLWELLVASNGRDSVVLVRGKFADMGLEPKLEREGAQRFSYKGFTLVGDEKNAVLFLNPSTAAAGPVPTLYRLVDNRNNVSGLPPALDQRVRKIPSTNQAWFSAQLGSGTLPELSASNAGIFTNLARLAQSIDFATGAIDLRSQFDTKIDLEAKDGQAADRLGGAIRGLLGLGRLNTGSEQKEVLSIYDGMGVTKEDKVLHFTTAIPYSVLEKAASQVPFLRVR
ncbi:MAG: hypothetical protein H7039_12055 [Bryobacteraceae bacterium]|nr:hypothetical protein [Bryobacteraceae bacterium]